MLTTHLMKKLPSEYNDPQRTGLKSFSLAQTVRLKSFQNSDSRVVIHVAHPLDKAEVCYRTTALQSSYTSHKRGFDKSLSSSALPFCILSEKSKCKMSNTETSSEFVLSHHRFLPFLSVFCIISTITSEHMGKHTKAEGHLKKKKNLCGKKL